MRVDVNAHAGHASAGGRCGRVILVGFGGGEGRGGEEDAGDGGGVFEGRAGEHRRIEDGGVEEVEHFMTVEHSVTVVPRKGSGFGNGDVGRKDPSIETYAARMDGSRRYKEAAPENRIERTRKIKTWMHPPATGMRRG